LMAKDPICGMPVDEASSLRAERDGQTFYFQTYRPPAFAVEMKFTTPI